MIGKCPEAARNSSYKAVSNLHVFFKDKIAMYDKLAIITLRCVICDAVRRGGNGCVISSRSLFVVLKTLTHTSSFLNYSVVQTCVQDH